MPLSGPSPRAKIVNIDSAVTAYTLLASDDYAIINMQSGSANTVTIPPDSEVNFPVGVMVTISQGGAGVTTPTAGAGVTINTPTADLALSAQYASRGFIKTAANTWREQVL